MRNRIHKLFEEKKENILSIYFTAGYPSLNDTISIIKALYEAGVDLVEIGFPFSDPLADGPVIQESSLRAIENGMNLKLLFEQLKELRTVIQMPVILMGYLNPVMQYGEITFIKKCNEIGIDGVIIPDMPLRYYQSQLKKYFEENNLSNILLISPQTSEERIRQIDESSDAFIYMVSSNNITGSNRKLDLQTEYFKRIHHMHLKHPTLTGFGIHDQESFKKAGQFSSGAIIGSAFIKHLSSNGMSKESILQFVKQIRP
ncbi:MAG: tryptophan synthase subunit alpha [Saprospiraceae bacterium]